MSHPLVPRNHASRRSSPGLTLIVLMLAVLAAGLASCGDDDDKPSAAGADLTEAKDPLPDFDEPGVVRCDGCPVVDGITDFEPLLVGVAAQTFSGKAEGANGNGTFYVEGQDREAYSGIIETDVASGNFTINVPLLCGEQTVKLAWSNDSGTSGVVLKPTTTDCVDAEIRITLAWDEQGSDFELHLVREGGVINDPVDDCTWTTCVGVSPDWGVEGDPSDNPSKDVDDTGTFGPENIVYPNPADGRYTVLIEHWGAGQPGATGVVTINVAGQPSAQIEVTGLDPQHVLTVATISWPEGTITPVVSDYDCTATWSRGCPEPLPLS